MHGYIKLHRSLLEHWLWRQRPFSPNAAWIDLLLRASWRAGETPRGQSAQRGEVHTAQTALAERWGWNRKTVKRFLTRLEEGHMLTQCIDHKWVTGGTTLTISNYDTYQCLEKEDTQAAAFSRPNLSPKRDTSEEYKKKKIYILPEIDAIWQLYPRKTGKAAALPKIQAAITQRGVAFIREAVAAYAAAVSRWPEADKRFVPYPATWFGQGRYDDDRATWVRKGQAVGPDLDAELARALRESEQALAQL